MLKVKKPLQWNPNFGENLARIRMSQDIELIELAQASGVYTSNLALIEEGIITPSQIELNAICFILKIDPENILFAKKIFLKKTGRVNVEDIFENWNKLKLTS